MALPEVGDLIAPPRVSVDVSRFDSISSSPDHACHLPSVAPMSRETLCRPSGRVREIASLTSPRHCSFGQPCFSEAVHIPSRVTCIEDVRSLAYEPSSEIGTRPKEVGPDAVGLHLSTEMRKGGGQAGAP